MAMRGHNELMVGERPKATTEELGRQRPSKQHLPKLNVLPALQGNDVYKAHNDNAES